MRTGKGYTWKGDSGQIANLAAPTIKLLKGGLINPPYNKPCKCRIISEQDFQSLIKNQRRNSK